jgi:hypothetical protein
MSIKEMWERENHWEHGPHLHYVSSAWINLDAEAVYQQVTNGKCRFPAVHIRWQDARQDDDKPRRAF